MIINHPHQHQSYEDALTLLCLACHYSHHLFKCFQNVSNVSKQPNESKHRKVTAASNEMQLGVKLSSSLDGGGFVWKKNDLGRPTISPRLEVFEVGD